MRIIYILLLSLISFLTLTGGELADTIQYPSNGVLVTPLMGLIDDQIPSLYYKRYLRNDSNSYFNIRIGTEILSKTKHEFSAGREDLFSVVNWKLGAEYGIRHGKSSLYFGAEFSRSVIKTTGAYLIPEEGALFKSNHNRVTVSNPGNDGRLRMASLHAFVGFRYHLNHQFSIGTEAAFGMGWFLSELRYDPDRQIPEEQHRGQVIDFIPVRFISLQYSF